MIRKVLDGFKLVFALTEEITSLTVPDDATGFVTYIPGEWVEPNEECGPLSVFKTQDDLIKFCRDYRWVVDLRSGKVQVWKCEWVRSEESILYYPKTTYEGTKPFGKKLEFLPSYECGFASKVKITENITDDIKLHFFSRHDKVALLFSS